MKRYLQKGDTIVETVSFSYEGWPGSLRRDGSYRVLRGGFCPLRWDEYGRPYIEVEEER